MSKSIILITGASSGIGAQIAFQMDKGFEGVEEFWLIGRCQERLNEIGRLLRHSWSAIPMDLCDEAALDRLRDRLRKEKACIRILVNSAGFGIMGPFADREAGEQAGMVRLNCEALVRMTHICIPFMKKGSRIIQLASSAAFLPQPDFAVYAASKSFVLSFSRALGEELREKKIYVTAVCPGPVDTPFFEIAERNGHTLASKKLLMVTPDQVAAKALRDAYHRKAKSVYSPWIMGFDALAKVLPHRALLDVMRLVKKIEGFQENRRNVKRIEDDARRDGE